MKSNAAGADLLAEWAAEEFVAAGRSVPAERFKHRQRALYLADALYALRDSGRHDGVARRNCVGLKQHSAL
jgi:hypothetical protein